MVYSYIYCALFLHRYSYIAYSHTYATPSTPRTVGCALEKDNVNLNMWSTLVETAVSLALARLVSESIFDGRWRRLLIIAVAAVTIASAGRAAAAHLEELLPLLHPPPFVFVFVALLFGHACGCMVDCWAHAPQIRPRDLLSCIAHATVYVLPVYPVLCVFGSALLFAGTSLLQLVGVASASVRWIVDLGALHLPFWFVHVQTRRLVEKRARETHLLPLSAAQPSTSMQGQTTLQQVVDANCHHDMRAHRLRYFTCR